MKTDRKKSINSHVEIPSLSFRIPSRYTYGLNHLNLSFTHLYLLSITFTLLLGPIIILLLFYFLLPFEWLSLLHSSPQLFILSLSDSLSYPIIVPSSKNVNESVKYCSSKNSYLSSSFPLLLLIFNSNVKSFSFFGFSFFPTIFIFHHFSSLWTFFFLFFLSLLSSWLCCSS